MIGCFVLMHPPKLIEESFQSFFFFFNISSIENVAKWWEYKDAPAHTQMLFIYGDKTKVVIHYVSFHLVNGKF